MKNEKRIPFETIEKVVEGEPEAIHNVVCYYRGYMKYLSVFQGGRRDRFARRGSGGAGRRIYRGGDTPGADQVHERNGELGV